MVIEMQPMAISLANKVSASHVWKQGLVSLTTGILCLCGGFTYGYSAVLVPALKADEEFPYSDEYDSWMAAIAPLSMGFGCIFTGMAIDNLGRKYTHILMLWPFLVGYLIQAFAKNITYMMLGRFLTGMCTGMFRSIGAVYLVEISDPKNRALMQLTLSLTSTIGILGSHVIGAYLSAKYSCLIFCTPIFVAFMLLIFLKESPLWLISKGKIEEGIEAFQWYRCKSEASQVELTNVLEAQKNKSDELTLAGAIKIIFSKKFFKAYCTAFVLFTMIQFCGLNNMIFYAQDLMKHTFSGKMNAYVLMLIADSIRILANVIFFPVLKYCPRRKTLFVLTSAVILLLTAIVVYLIVEPTNLVWLLLVCVIAFVFICGIVISLAWTFVGEIFPNEVRGFGAGMSASTSYLMLFVSVKITPQIMNNFGITALYSTYAITTSIALVLLFFLLPDTDGKSLHDIEKSYDT